MEAEKASNDFIAAAQSLLANGDEEARKMMVGTVMQAMGMLESPSDAVGRIIILIRPPLSAATRSLANLPFYLEKMGFDHTAVEGAIGAFQDAHRTNDGMFPWLIKNPPMMGNFNAFMTGQRADRKQWFDFFDINGILLDGAKSTDADPDATLLIDIGGGEGYDLAQFHKRYPAAPRNLIVQDLPEVSDSIQDLTAEIKRQKYNFFTEQPVRSARCYYFRSTFHDWPDKDCIEILKNIAKAMEPGYSKLLFSEFVLPACNVPLYPALLDINMMGLKVVKFWSVGAETEGLVEAVLKDE
ncbi:O-methyltransferase [Xylariomycetidae sp. FL0641]|nr:O-methyltransferase [Xylariomycetidae sp. FL0641]